MQKALGKYQLEERLGEGGFGEVYKAWHPELKVYRALKIPFAQGEEIERQIKEAQLQAQLPHPNIAQVIDVDKAEGKLFIVMEYVEGGSLKDRMNKGSISIEEGLDYAIQTCQAISFAHKKNIVHHDLKPENILITKDNQVKVVDFGIARIVRESQKVMSRVQGTIYYMAPEQLEGKADLRSDIWSLGMILYEMLTGKSCFCGQTAQEIIKKIMLESPLPPKDLNAAIPERLQDIILRMLEKDVDKRYQRIDDVVKDLRPGEKETLVAEETMLVQTPEGESQVSKKRIFRWSLAGVLIVFLAFGGLLTFKVLHVPTDSKEPPIEPLELPSSFLSLPSESKMEKAQEYLEKGEHVLAYHAYSHIVDHSRNSKIKAKAMFFKATLLCKFLNRPKSSITAFKQLITDYTQSEYIDDAYYYLGMVYLDQNRLKEAVYHFTYLIDNFPKSNQFSNAKFLAQRCARMLVEQKDSQKDYMNLVNALKESGIDVPQK